MQKEIELLVHQYEFIMDMTTPYILLLGGLGSGKTWGYASKAVTLCLENPGFSGTIMEPTGPLLQDILVPTLEEVLEVMEIKYRRKDNQQKPNYYIDCGNGKITELRLRSAENWKRQIGSNQAFIGADEIDTMDLNDAVQMVRKSQPRIRKGLKRQFFFSSTPEGFNFCFEFFEKLKDPEKRTIKAKTMDNPHLPDDYVDRLRRLYPDNLVDAYINGEYVNLTGQRVYNFDRYINHTDAIDDGREPLHIGMDFNITNMSAVVFVIRNGNVLAVDEFSGIYDTAQMIRILKDKYQSRTMLIYPDASGANRTTSAAETDIDLLKAAKFYVIAPSKNPYVKDRINSMNAMFKNGAGESRLFVNTEKCPIFTESLERQNYNEKNEPDKKSGFDHINDAAGYFIYSKFPIRRPSGVRQSRG